MPEFNLRTVIGEQMVRLARRYRKEYSTDEILAMAKETAISLQYVPVKQIVPLFDAVFDKYRFFPNDKQILNVWEEMKSKTTRSNGYFDIWGNWVIAGTAYTALSCPWVDWVMQAGDRAKYLALRASHGALNPEQQIEWNEICLKIVKPNRGAVQIPIKNWQTNEWQIHEKTMETYNLKAEQHNQLALRVEKELELTQ